MRLVSYAFTAAVLVVVCFAYAQFWWMLVSSELPQVSGWVTGGASTNVDVQVQASARMVVSRMGLPAYADDFPPLWPVHMLFYTLLWSGFLMAAFADLIRRVLSYA